MRKVRKKRRLPKQQEKKREDSAKTSRKSGVKFEISQQGQQRFAGVQQRTAFVEQVRELAKKAVTFLKALWDKIWNEAPKEKEIEFPIVLAEHIEEAQEKQPEIHPLEARDSLAWSIYSQEEIRAIFRRGDPKEIQDFLSEHGERRLAKNSDLLTQYDKRGTIVGIDRSDKELILHGNKNEIGL